MEENEKIAKLGFLIRALETEMPEYAGYDVPSQLQPAFNLYRALCNVRPPQGHTLPAEFYQVQADVLQAITRDKGITDAQAVQPSQKDRRLAVWQGDITTLQADAIVNAANSQMLGCFQPLHNCIDNIIHTMAGVELRETCYQMMRAQGRAEATGQAKITPACNLPAKYVIHTVGPIVTGRLSAREIQQLASCYTSVLDLAAAYQLQSVAFCCISTGVFRFPPEKAADIAVHTVQDWLDGHSGCIQKVIFNVFKDSDKQWYDQWLN